MKITVLGKPRFASPIRRTISDGLRVPEHIMWGTRSPVPAGTLFELAGPRARLFFDPRRACAGIVTCGGLCPGLNDVIRSLFLELHHAYGVKEVLGFRGGYQGLDPQLGAEPIGFADLPQHVGHERLSAESRLDGHDEEDVEASKEGSCLIEGRPRLDRKAGLLSLSADAVERDAGIMVCFQM